MVAELKQLPLCPGFGDEECFDELDEGQELCPAHRHAEIKFYQDRQAEEDRRDEERCKSQYSYLSDEREG
jgi:hypothetical protein